MYQAQPQPGRKQWKKMLMKARKKVDAKPDNDNSYNEVMVMSPAKVTRKATTSSGIPQEALQVQQDLVQGLIQQWVNM